MAWVRWVRAEGRGGDGLGRGDGLGDGLSGGVGIGDGVRMTAMAAGDWVGPGVAVRAGTTIVKPRAATEMDSRTTAESRHSR